MAHNTGLRRRFNSKLHQCFQKAIEKVFFRGDSTSTSAYLTYAVGNVVLMLVLFYVLLNRVAYDWTGQLYPASGRGSVRVQLPNVLPFEEA